MTAHAHNSWLPLERTHAVQEILRHATCYARDAMLSDTIRTNPDFAGHDGVSADLPAASVLAQSTVHLRVRSF